jgi:ABC-type transport system substrate-binding protein
MTKRNRYSNLEVDRRIEEIQSMPDSPDRNRLLIEVDRLIYDDAPWVFLWHSVSQVVTQQWISGFEPKLMFNAQRYINVSKKLSE